MGTEAMAHGAAKTKEPIREGLVAMLGPMIDTLIVCTITGLIILSTGVWESTGDSPNGVLLTAEAFKKGIPDRKSTRLNSSHKPTSYAVFCLKKKRRTEEHTSEILTFRSIASVCRL